MEWMTEEALRMRRFPGIGFRGPESDRRAWVLGTAFDVWEIIKGYRDFGSLERIVAEGDLAERPVRLALAYCEAYPEEIDRMIAENQITPEEAHRRYPSLFAKE